MTSVGSKVDPIKRSAEEAVVADNAPATKKPKMSTASILAASVAHLSQAKPSTVSQLSTTSAGVQLGQPTVLISSTAHASKPSKATKVAKKELPHVLIWVSHNGTRPGSGWTNKSLRIVGVYGSKVEAENKKNEIIDQHETAGYGDILVGDTCWDEIDLVVRPAGECTL